MKKKELKRMLKLSISTTESRDEEIKKLHSIIIEHGISIPYIKNTLNALDEVVVDATTTSKDEIVEPLTTFSSRFMPNAVFEAKDDMSSISDVLDTSVFRNGYTHFKVNNTGDNFSVLTPIEFKYIRIKKVSIYEAIPELVPDGMVYYKESDSLVQKTCDNPMCSGEDCMCGDVPLVSADDFVNDPEAFEEVIKTSLSFNIELSNLLNKMQLLVYKESYPVFQGVEFSISDDKKDKMKTNHTISFATINSKK